jgi:hypothetical protein
MCRDHLQHAAVLTSAWFFPRVTALLHTTSATGNCIPGIDFLCVSEELARRREGLPVVFIQVTADDDTASLGSVEDDSQHVAITFAANAVSITVVEEISASGASSSTQPAPRSLTMTHKWAVAAFSHLCQCVSGCHSAATTICVRECDSIVPATLLLLSVPMDTSADGRALSPICSGADGDSERIHITEVVLRFIAAVRDFAGSGAAINCPGFAQRCATILCCTDERLFVSQSLTCKIIRELCSSSRAVVFTVCKNGVVEALLRLLHRDLDVLHARGGSLVEDAVDALNVLCDDSCAFSRVVAVGIDAVTTLLRVTACEEATGPAKRTSARVLLQLVRIADNHSTFLRAQPLTYLLDALRQSRPSTGVYVDWELVESLMKVLALIAGCVARALVRVPNAVKLVRCFVKQELEAPVTAGLKASW